MPTKHDFPRIPRDTWSGTSRKNLSFQSVMVILAHTQLDSTASNGYFAANFSGE